MYVYCKVKCYVINKYKMLCYLLMNVVVPFECFPFLSGDVALLEDNIAVEESGILDGPGLVMMYL